jgi:hypothetical protein
MNLIELINKEIEQMNAQKIDLDTEHKRTTKSKRGRGRPLMVENEIFVEMWKAAVTAGGLEQVAANLGISKASCAVKASNMRKAGYDLPQFRRGRPKKNQ